MQADNVIIKMTYAANTDANNVYDYLRNCLLFKHTQLCANFLSRKIYRGQHILSKKKMLILYIMYMRIPILLL